MEKITLNNIYSPADSLVARKVHGEMVIFFMTCWTGNLEDEFSILNETGEFIWNNLDGKRNLKDIAEKMASEIKESGEEISIGEIEKDVISFAEELLKKEIIVKV